jgi:phosphatidate cytidylyltransferase
MQWFKLSAPVQLTIGGILAVLGIATLTVAALRIVRPHRDWSELTLRIQTWWVLTVVFVGALVSSRAVAIIFFALACFLAFKEYLSLIPTRRADRRVLFWAYLAIPLQFYWVYAEWYGMFIIFIPVYMFLLLPLRMITIGQTEGFLRAAGTIHWGLMTTVFSLSHAAFLLILRFKDDPASMPGPGLVLFLVVMTQLNDVAQYIWGKSLGRRKIVPAVSPGKTWVGFLGGVGTSIVLAAVLGPFLTPMDLRQSLGAGLLISVAGFVGDVNMSALKRDLHVKDSGTMLPGHGGVLDRVDSLTYTAPLFFHYVYWQFVFQTHGSLEFSP